MGKSITERLFLNLAILVPSIVLIEILHLVLGSSVNASKLGVLQLILTLGMLFVHWKNGLTLPCAWGFAIISEAYWAATFHGKMGDNALGTAITLIFIGTLYDYFTSGGVVSINQIIR